MSMNIAVVGPGGLGSVVGGMLSKAGHRIWLIDHWPDHVQVLKANALRVCLGGEYSGTGDPHTLHGDYRVPIRAYHVYQVVTVETKFDIVFVGAKTYDAAWMATMVKPRLADNGYVVSLQGGLEDNVSTAVGVDLTVGCVYASGAWLLQPDVTWSATSSGISDAYVVGELDGRDTPRLRDLVGLLASIGPTRATNDLAGTRWTRAIFDVMVDAKSALTGKTVQEIATTDEFAAEAALLGAEAIEVGRAAGWSSAPLFGLQQADLDTDPNQVARTILQAGCRSVAAGYISAMAQDVARGRPTEIDQLNGLIRDKGAELGVPTAQNAEIVEKVAGLERA